MFTNILNSWVPLVGPGLPPDPDFPKGWEVANGEPPEVMMVLPKSLHLLSRKGLIFR